MSTPTVTLPPASPPDTHPDNPADNRPDTHADTTTGRRPATDPDTTEPPPAMHGVLPARIGTGHSTPTEQNAMHNGVGCAGGRTAAGEPR